MKKNIICIMTICLSLLLNVNQTNAATSKSTSLATTEKSASTMSHKAMMNRLGEIKQLDRSKLSLSERKEIRTELLGMKKAIIDGPSGVYISGGALVLIIILLIIFL